MMSTMVYIFWSCRNTIEAKKIIYQLLHQRLIACASIVTGVESIYRWAGKIEESEEVKVILKTHPQHFDAIQKMIHTHGSYDVPEIVQIDVSRGNPSYLSWIAQETTCSDTT